MLEMPIAKAIKVEDAQNYFWNYQYFEEKRATTEAQYDCKWVAFLNFQSLSSIPNTNRAYVEHVGRVI